MLHLATNKGGGCHSDSEVLQGMCWLSLLNIFLVGSGKNEDHIMCSFFFKGVILFAKGIDKYLGSYDDDDYYLFFGLS